MSVKVATCQECAQAIEGGTVRASVGTKKYHLACSKVNPCPYGNRLNTL
jgi:hypothetical protein